MFFFLFKDLDKNKTQFSQKEMNLVSQSGRRKDRGLFKKTPNTSLWNRSSWKQEKEIFSLETRKNK